MTTVTIPNVQPGDLITAAGMNALIAELAALEVRVAQLEAAPPATTPGPTGPPVLTSRFPTGDVSVGSLLTLRGNRFLPLAQTHVDLDGTTITQFGPTSSDTELVVIVPPLTGLPKTVQVRVERGGQSSAALSVGIQAGGTLPQGGDVFIDPASIAQPAPTVGQPVSYQWSVRSETLQPATYNFTPVLTGALPAGTLAAWQSAISLNATQRQITAGSPFTVVATGIVPAGAQSVNLALKAESTDSLFNKTSSPIGIVVGTVTAVSDPRVQLVLASIGPFDSGGQPNTVRRRTDASGNPVVEVKPSATGAIPLNVTFVEPGTYQFRSSIETPGSPPIWSPATISPAQLAVATGGESHTILFGIQNLGTAPTAGDATFLVARAFKRNGTNTSDVFESFSRIAIRGAAF